MMLQNRIRVKPCVEKNLEISSLFPAADDENGDDGGSHFPTSSCNLRVRR